MLKDKSVNNLTLADSFGQPPTGFEGIVPTEKVMGSSCKSEDIDYSKGLIANITHILKESNQFPLLTDSLWYAGIFMLNDLMLNCSNYLDQKLEKYNNEFSYNSSLCFHSPQSEAYMKDPCCNPFYQWSDQCCISRSVSTSQVQYNAPYSNATDSCSTEEKTSFILQDYITLRNLAFDPIYVKKHFFFFFIHFIFIF